MQTEQYKQWLFTVFTVLLFVALVLAEKTPALLSIATIGQAASVLLLTKPSTLLKNLTSNKAVILFILSYLFLLLSFFYSNNLSYLTERLQIKVPLLILPIVWINVGRLNQHLLRTLVFTFIGVISITCIGILANYFMHFKAINQLYLESKIMPGPINHIRFSLLAVFAVYLSYYFIKTYHCIINQKQVLVIVLNGLFLVLFLHIYSVRSGLLALYVTFAICLFNYFIRSRNIKHLLLAGLIIALTSASSFILSPTMRNKLLNTKQDVAVYKAGEDPNYNSISTRFVSYKVALSIFKTNIWFGCGQGDLADENNARFREQYPSIITPIIPHNQFILYMAATGIIGLLIFVVCFTAPLWYAKFYKFEIMQIGYGIILLAFQFEAMIETQVGVMCTVLLLFISYYLVQLKHTTAE